MRGLLTEACRHFLRVWFHWLDIFSRLNLLHARITFSLITSINHIPDVLLNHWTGFHVLGLYHGTKDLVDRLRNSVRRLWGWRDER